MMIEVNGPLAVLIKEDSLMEKTKKAFRLQCLFNSIWDGAMKTVDFRAGSAAASVELNGNECRIPSKCLELGGVPLKIRIRGEKDGRKLITNWCQTNKILYNIVSRSSPSANLYDEFINALSGLTEEEVRGKTLTEILSEIEEAIGITATDEEVDGVLVDIFESGAPNASLSGGDDTDDGYTATNDEVDDILNDVFGD